MRLFEESKQKYNNENKWRVKEFLLTSNKQMVQKSASHRYKIASQEAKKEDNFV